MELRHIKILCNIDKIYAFKKDDDTSESDPEVSTLIFKPR